MKKSAKILIVYVIVLLSAVLCACSPIDEDYGVTSNQENGGEAMAAPKTENTTIMSSDRVMSKFFDISLFDEENYSDIYLGKRFKINAEFIDITESTANLKEFLSIRDTDSMFESVKEEHRIGIPLFVNENGKKTFDINEALSWIGQEKVKEDELVEKSFTCGNDGCK